MRLPVLCLLLAACSGHASPGEPAKEAAKATPPPPPPPPPAPPLLDAKVAATCTVSFDCFLSHPGLGSSSNTVADDLSTCTRTKHASSGPYDGDAVPSAPVMTPPDAPPPPPPPETIAPADCRRVLDLLSALTAQDLKDAQESAQVDSVACSLAVSCPNTSGPPLRVQRQTTSGNLRVEQLIRAL